MSPEDALASLVARQNDLDRRLRIMEGTQRSGLGLIGSDGGDSGFTVSTFETTNFSSAWVDDAAGGSTPEVTVTTGSRVVAFASFRLTQVGPAGPTVGVNDYRCSALVAGIGIDSDEPHQFDPPSMRVSYSLGGTAAGSSVHVPITFAVTRDDLTPGEHTFRLMFSALDSHPTGTTFPLITDTSLIVFPLGFA